MSIKLIEESLTTFEQQLINEFESEDEDTLPQFYVTPIYTTMRLLPLKRKQPIDIPHLPVIVHPSINTKLAEQIIVRAPKNSIFDAAEEGYECKLCRETFYTGQALGGHMSRKHPGMSKDYMHKKEIRSRRLTDRMKLRLAKIRYYSSLGLDYLQLKRTDAGMKTLKSKLNRSQLKKIKLTINDSDVDSIM